MKLMQHLRESGTISGICKIVAVLTFIEGCSEGENLPGSNLYKIVKTSGYTNGPKMFGDKVEIYEDVKLPAQHIEYDPQLHKGAKLPPGVSIDSLAYFENISIEAPDGSMIVKISFDYDKDGTFDQLIVRNR